jgi:hypothetical protein
MVLFIKAKARNKLAAEHDMFYRIRGQKLKCRLLISGGSVDINDKYFFCTFRHSARFYVTFHELNEVRLN